ncbi:hypothetical protein FCULG_00012504 [Fusarium culmorum]|uniref:Uncharacterized protein n=1 Tax=Fusarium culmorum TaxID=5516 RepID=A0A2T4GYB0_FUSCU|nr:hypothetical protein FCULG_00012504 [Fusarium culmorum]
MAEIVGLYFTVNAVLDAGATPSNVLQESGSVRALGMTMAAWSDVSKSLTVAGMLLKATADVELANSFSATPLIVAASNDNSAAIEMPVSAGGDLETFRTLMEFELPGLNPAA